VACHSRRSLAPRYIEGVILKATIGEKVRATGFLKGREMLSFYEIRDCLRTPVGCCRNSERWLLYWFYSHHKWDVPL